MKNLKQIFCIGIPIGLLVGLNILLMSIHREAGKLTRETGKLTDSSFEFNDRLTNKRDGIEEPELIPNAFKDQSSINSIQTVMTKNYCERPVRIMLAYIPLDYDEWVIQDEIIMGGQYSSPIETDHIYIQLAAEDATGRIWPAKNLNIQEPGNHTLNIRCR